MGTAAGTLLAGGALTVQQYDRRHAVPVALNGWVEVTEEGQIDRVFIGNAAPDPVYDIVARVIFDGEVIGSIAPGVVVPGVYEEKLNEPRQMWACVADLMVTHEFPKVALMFRDARGRVWRKGADSRIRRFRGDYQWVQESVHALNECPPMIGYLDGQPVEIGDRVAAPRWVTRTQRKWPRLQRSREGAPINW